jgi:uncharacterized protein YbjT (DUF2867 family)
LDLESSHQRSVPLPGKDRGTVLAVGAAGKFAGLVVPALARRGAKVRAFIRKADESDAVRKAGATDVAIGDLSDLPSVQRALQGVESVFYVAPAFLPKEADLGAAFVTAARQAAVRRFVFSSVIHPVLTELVNHAAKIPVEEAVLNSAMEYVFLHPAMFFQNFAAAFPKIRETGIFGEPWSNDTRFSHVDYRDVAEVAAIALTEDRLLYGTFELCAEGNLNRWDVARLISEVIGREVKPVKVDISKPTKKTEPGDEQKAMLQKMFDWYDHHPLLGNAITLRAILQHEPRTLREYFEQLATT